MTFNPLNHPVCLETPLWLEESAWTQHLPFAMYVISAMRPRTLVELGSFRGTSYCTFCQAVEATESGTKCFAVDTWKGDEHSGELESWVFEKLKSHHDPRYSEFSKLLRKTFDEALADFEDGSVDLLHIDGFHTYDAVSHDFNTWLPKLSDRAVVLFHDTNVRENDFGVWKFWEEVTQKYPGFEFLHGYGLGVLAVGKDIPEGLRELFSASPAETDAIRKLFSGLGAGVEGTPLIIEKLNNPGTLTERLAAKFLPLNAVYVLFTKGPSEFMLRARKKLGR